MEMVTDVMHQVFDFVRESNRIEGILRDPKQEEFEATLNFLSLDTLAVPDVVHLVSVYQPGAQLRLFPGVNVRVGDHIAPPGGPEIGNRLAALLDGLPKANAWRTHVEYETLHPFTDGNGRSGRAVWAWQMLRRQRGLPLGFLHQFYYQTLHGVRLEAA